MSELPIGKKCALLAKAKNISQSAIAKEIGISRVSLNRFFNNRSALGVVEFSKLSRVLGLNIQAELDKLLLSARDVGVPQTQQLDLGDVIP